jgi:hypothetical protein
MNNQNSMKNSHAKNCQVINDALALGNDIEQLAVRVFSRIALAQNALAEQFMFAMAVRCLNCFRASLLLSHEYLAQPAAACVRSLIEQRWVFEAVAADNTRGKAIKWLNEHGEYNRKRALDNLRKLPSGERDHRITDEALSKIEEGLGVAAYHSLKCWAELAGRESEYLSAYARLCDRIHPSSNAIDSHLLYDDSGQLLSITAIPDADLLLLDLTQACEAMIDVIAACPESWQTADVIADATSLRQRVNGLWQLVPDPLADA